MTQPSLPSEAPLPPYEPASARQERSFPLVALLQLATFGSALAACVDPKALGAAIKQVSSEPVAAAVAVVCAILAGGALGFTVGLGQLRMWRSAALGAAVGSLYALVVLGMYVAPAPLEMSAAAAAMLLVTTIALRVGAP